jgi:putative oxidoreductase
MNGFLIGRYREQVYAIMRFVLGLLFAVHGTQKLFAYPPSGMPKMSIASFAGFGGLLELVGGLMIAFGFFGALAAFICSGEMAVAYFKFHAPGGFFPVVNKGELAVVYCFIFLYIAAHGSGIWSIDALMRRGRVVDDRR